MKKLLSSTAVLLALGLALNSNAAGKEDKKAEYNKAKEECSQQQPPLKGKALKACIKEKMKK